MGPSAKDRGRHCTPAVAGLAGLLILALAFRSAAAGAASSPKYLYVWAGANDTRANDTLFILDVSKNSGNKFGSLVASVETPYQGLEPHHCGVSSDGRWLGAGGLLSVLTPGLPSVLFFDLKPNPAKPTLVKNVVQPKYSAVADEFLASPSGGFIISMMGSASGGTPGRIAHYDKKLKLVGEYAGATDAAPGFNPHGMGWDTEREILVTSDYVDPSTTLTVVPGPPALRPTVRIWDTKSKPFKIVNVLNSSSFVPSIPAAVMDVIRLGNTGKYYATDGRGNLLYVDPAKPQSFRPVYQFYNASVAACLGMAFRSGTRLALTMYPVNTLYLFDTTNPEKPVLLDKVVMEAGTGGHMVKVSKDEKLVAVSTYFLDEGAAGKVRFPGDQTVRFFSLNKDATKITPHAVTPKVDFKTILPKKGGFRPHGLAFSYV